jgi:hypothetical protein
MLQDAVQRTHSEPVITGGLTPGAWDETGAGTAADTSPAHGRLARLLHRLPEINLAYYDPRLDWPNLVEDDYYRLRNQPIEGSDSHSRTDSGRAANRLHAAVQQGARFPPPGRASRLAGHRDQAGNACESCTWTTGG